MGGRSKRTYIFISLLPSSVAGLADSREYCWMSVARWYRLSTTWLRVDSISSSDGKPELAGMGNKKAPRASASSTL